MCLLPAEVADEVGYDVVVADTVNHALRGVRLSDGSVRTLAGTDVSCSPAPRSEGALSSPWDVEWWQDRVWVAMAGIHQLWTFDPATGAVEVAAGATNEGLRRRAAVPGVVRADSGLAADGERLWLADSETSSVRWVSTGR